MAKKTNKKKQVVDGTFKFYKVLSPRTDYAGKTTITGGHTPFDYTPYLPPSKGPGKWLPVRKSLKMCHSGWHVTRRPARWVHGTPTRVFLVEGKGQPKVELYRNYSVLDRISPNAYIESDKRAYSSIRLVKELTKETKRKVLLSGYQKVQGE